MSSTRSGVHGRGWTFGVLVGLACVAGIATQEETAPGEVYDLTINGETFEVEEGVETVLESASGDVAWSVLLERRTIRSYATDHLAFDYHRDYSLTDDFDTEGRTVTLMHAGGSMVITDLGGADELEALLDALVVGLVARFERDGAGAVEASDAIEATFAHSDGLTRRVTYTDNDGDPNTCDVFVLYGGGRGFSVIRQHSGEHGAAIEEMSEPTLQSIRGVGGD